MEASFLVSIKIAKFGKPHTIGEELLLPAAKNMVTCMFGKSSAKQLDMMQVSNKIVCRSIESIAIECKRKCNNSGQK